MPSPLQFSALQRLIAVLVALGSFANSLAVQTGQGNASRRRISLNKGWRFSRSETNHDGLVYDVRSDTPPRDKVHILKPWILPTANGFISDHFKHHSIPTGSAPGNVSFVQKTFNDSSWEEVDLPHDWAIKGPFYVGDGKPVMGGMGRLPIQGVAWYRRTLDISQADIDAKKTIYLDIDGAMSYSMVWLNGHLIGGWPCGYTSYRLDLTPHVQQGNRNQLAIRLDNPVQSSRWYPGAGLYRSVWLTTVQSVHVPLWGQYVSSRNISRQSATVDFRIQLKNNAKRDEEVVLETDIYELDISGRPGAKVLTSTPTVVKLNAGSTAVVNSSIVVTNPKLWGPPPTQVPNLYAALTRLTINGHTVDTYETQFGIRSLRFDPDRGLFVNGERIRIQGVNEHHDLGALGVAFNYRAAERKLEILRELGANAIRCAHNIPATEFLQLADKMGFLVTDESLDSWEYEKTPNDYHLLFGEWAEADTRAMLRRDRNHPSVIAFSVGNEVSEQTTGVSGATTAKRLCSIVREEDDLADRPCTASKNAARPEMPFASSLDIINLNYQGEGIRDTPAYEGLQGITTEPSYGEFHRVFPDKLILSSETSASLSTRGTYFFPLTREISAPVLDNKPDGGGNASIRAISDYSVYTTPFGASPDKVFAKQDAAFPYVAGEFVWSGFDYLGEPTPYYSARSSYFGIVDLAGFKKDRFWLYQSRWRPEVKMAHVLPHWSWGGDREGQVTPVHILSSADEAQLFVNGKNHGRKKKQAGEYRFRYDDVVYSPGELLVLTWKDGKEWANKTVFTVGDAYGLTLEVDRESIEGDGLDLAFVTAKVVDLDGRVVPTADNNVIFSVEGAGAEIVATDNGDPYSFVPFPSKQRKAFSGLALAIIKATAKTPGTVTVRAESQGLRGAKVEVSIM
ncbi:glycoside hydrolase family 2 protein [Apiosordaria backusii]|uniref:Glycoside hydrolase family 2 protein n=1 Tax=Apiosordaria backusii TaxID=314023 RepID=A0AA39ZRX6_9PEZI|nr:glycoside hydrolase family 2 protein [Apiosordaria backusii]